MRIVHLEARSFGPLSGKRFQLAGALQLFVGPNEAGKSSLVAAVQAALYGFKSGKSAEPSFHAALAEGASELELLAELQADDGERVIVRRLQGAPARGRSRGSEPTVAELGSIQRELYESLYALGPDSAVELARAARAPLERMLAGDPPLAERPGVDELRRALAEEAKRLWREDQRGRPRAAELRAELLRARSELARAHEHERGLHEALVEREQLARELAGLGERRRRLLAEQAELALVCEAAELEREEDRLAPLAAWLEPPLEDVGALEERVRTLQARLQEPRARLERPPARLTEAELRVLAAESEIERAREESAREKAELEQLGEVHGEVRIREREGSLLATALFGRSLQRGELQALARLPLESLREAGREWAGAEERRQRARATTTLWLGLVLAGLLVAAVVLALRGEPLARPLGIACGGLTLVLGLARWLDRRGRGRLPPSLTVLAELGLDASAWSSAAALERSFDRLASIATSLRAAEEERGHAAEIAAELEEREERWLELSERIGSADCESGASALETALEALTLARRAAEEVDRDALEREHAHLAIEAHDGDLEEAEQALARVEERLRRVALGERDRAAAQRSLARARQEWELVRSRRALLLEDPRARALEQDPRVQAALADPQAWKAAGEARITLALEELEQELARTHRRAGEIDEQLKSDGGGSLARAAEEIAALEEELLRVARRRDRLLLLESLLARAQAVYRAEHGRDVLARSSEWLARLTAGEWQKLEWQPLAREPLHVFHARRATLLPVAPPLSRGLRDQVHLCLRLGLIEHFEAGGERLPLLLDEVFVHWDRERRLAFYPVLRELARERQLLLFTCHDFLAEELEQALGIARVALDASPSAAIP